MYLLGDNVNNMLRSKNTCSVLFVSFVTTLALSLFFYVLAASKEALTLWNHSIAYTTLAGISINKRIFNFYAFFLVIVPALMVLNIQLYSYLNMIRPKYIISLVRTQTFFLFAITVCWLTATKNDFLVFIISCIFLMICISVFDKNQQLHFEHITVILLTFTILSATLGILNFAKSKYTIVLSFFMMLLYSIILLKTVGNKKFHELLESIAYTVMWLPALFGIVLEILYYRIENDMESPSSLSLVFLALIIIAFA